MFNNSMKVIEVDDEVFELLKSRAEPLVDDANSVLRRLLGVGKGKSGPSSASAPRKDAAPPPRAPQGSLLPERSYRTPILLELLERGGAGAAKEVIDSVGRRVDSQLTDRDREPLYGGELRWRARVQFTRLRMREDGLIKGDSPRGVWELTPRGEAAAKAASG